MFFLSHTISWLLQQSDKTRDASWDKNGNRYNSEAAPQNVASRRVEGKPTAPGDARAPALRTKKRHFTTNTFFGVILLSAMKSMDLI